MAKYAPLDYAFAVQGLFLVFNGILFLLIPTGKVSCPPILEGTSNGVLHILSTSTLSVAVSFLIAAYYQERALMVAGVPGRILAALLFYSHGGEFVQVAAFEGAVGVLIAVLLVLERRKGGLKVE
ncbi:hypothetical protein K402DRAFT_173105 [Aulographum hederae CBS 113979]|uniref:DUF4345 domain-containing protein n=1 Tax=Aulographum hederae CBS 113979 TaxID=1176131 RepID=A0A6G1HD93_9PEZI|nr:hypothetical protein K402DRAFT_173105 [Aulographum hederae CBS 113979]